MTAMCIAVLLAATVGAPATDPSSVNVCEKVPGQDVARVLTRTLRSAKPLANKESRISRCVYIVAASTGITVRLGAQ